ncbi:hypothetical protein M405DRAFT_831469, partial [Rhizopogon salebrosus TDB-379]
MHIKLRIQAFEADMEYLKTSKPKMPHRPRRTYATRLRSMLLNILPHVVLPRFGPEPWFERDRWSGSR